MSTSRHPQSSLFSTAYAVGALLMILPPLNALVAVWPPHPSQAMWRFGASGVLASALLLPLLGTALAVYAASLLGHRRILRALGTFSLLVGVSLVPTLGLFSLDAVRLRAFVQPEVVSRFSAASGTAVIVYLLVLLGWAWIGLQARAAARARASGHSPAAREGTVTVPEWGAQMVGSSRQIREREETPA